jgi:hypothetical protein
MYGNIRYINHFSSFDQIKALSNGILAKSFSVTWYAVTTRGDGVYQQALLLTQSSPGRQALRNTLTVRHPSAPTV